MHPIDHYETLRRGREELLKRAEYERMARNAIIKHRMKKNIHQLANWLGMHLVSVGEKNKHFGAFFKRQPTLTTTKRVDNRPLSKFSPHH
jgi:hypothetical protein